MSLPIPNVGFYSGGSPRQIPVERLSVALVGSDPVAVAVPDQIGAVEVPSEIVVVEVR